MTNHLFFTKNGVSKKDRKKHNEKARYVSSGLVDMVFILDYLDISYLNRPFSFCQSGKSKFFPDSF